MTGVPTATEQAGVKPQLGNLLNTRFQDAITAGLDKKDWSAIYEIIGKE